MFLKTCEYPGCDHKFPEHYVSDFCVLHQDEELEAKDSEDAG